MARSDVFLADDFPLFPFKNSSYHIEIRKSGLTYWNNQDKYTVPQYLHFGDITGCHCKRLKSEVDKSCYISVYAYPLQTKSLSGKRFRSRCDLTFCVNKYADYESNLNLCQKWRNVIIRLARNMLVKKQDIDKCEPPPPRKIMVLINPHSGPGKAQEIFQSGVARMLEEADISYTMVVTERAGHAQELMKTINISEWYGIVIVSGDGLIYEAINGLMSRPDWDQAINLPVGTIPGGSGNAMSLNINYTAGEPLDVNPVLHSTFVLIKHRIIPMDLVLVQTPSQQIYSFLSVTFGMIADIDFESERMRMLGATRFTVYFVKRLVSLRKYKARVSFLPLTHYDPNSRQQKKRQQTFAKSRRFTILNHSSTHSNINGAVYENGVNGVYKSMSLPSHRKTTRSMTLPDMNHVSESLKEEFRQRRADSELSDCGEENTENVTIELEKADTDTYANSHLESDAQENVNGDNMSTHSDSPFEDMVSIVKNGDGPVPSPLLTPLDCPVPSEWTTIEDDFVTVCALYQPYLGPDNLAAPDSRLNDGVIHLFLIRGDVTKVALLNLFLGIDKGDHINSPFSEMIKVLAFRIEPITEPGNIMVDGEKVEYGPIQGQVLPGMAKVMGMQ